ncbi:MAG: ATP-binding cassette domain-containing protein, partial [Planctomycetaceae bacterium]|nr:ATP-binding cassette domain-containing protein [Planctomycetaceae bacterium]
MDSLRQSDPAAADPANAAICVRNVTLAFSAPLSPVLADVSCTIRAGELVAIVGPSGCGKSTLLRLIAGLLTPSSGTIEIDRGSTSESVTASDFGFVFQHPTLLPWRSAIANLRLPLELGTGADSELRTNADLIALLQQVGLKSTDADKRPGELSGGMQMRLSLARALVTRPRFLLLDEPFAALDDLLRLRLQEDVRRLHEQQQLTSLLVTHNVHEAVYMADRILLMGGQPATICAEHTIITGAAREPSFRNQP